jgi:hypothetical protein
VPGESVKAPLSPVEPSAAGDDGFARYVWQLTLPSAGRYELRVEPDARHGTIGC